MATYVFSDIHGHAEPLRRLLDRISPEDDDRFYCLGDMVDRGPAPLDVIELVRMLPNVCVLSGNHEILMLDWIHRPNSFDSLLDWSINGGVVTKAAFERLDPSKRSELVSWLEALPAYAVCAVSDRIYVLVHAGITPYRGTARDWDEDALRDMLSETDPQVLIWVREQFWEHPTGLIDETGAGPIVIAGHTPSRYLMRMDAVTDRPPLDGDGLCQSVRVGDPEACGGIWDKWDIDSGCAGGAGFGKVTIIRLDDGAEFTEPIARGE